MPQIFGVECTTDLIHKYAILIFITIIYYIVAFAIVKYCGPHWIVIAWSFPIILIWFFLLANVSNNTEKVNTQNFCTILGYFSLSFLLLLVVTLIAWSICYLNVCNVDTILHASIVAWLIFSVILLYIIWPQHVVTEK